MDVQESRTTFLSSSTESFGIISRFKSSLKLQVVCEFKMKNTIGDAIFDRL